MPTSGAGVISRTVVDSAGNVLAGASVAIRSESTLYGQPAGGLVSLYSDYNLSLAVANPVNADSNGFFEVYALPGVYKITATHASGTIEWRYHVMVGTAGWRNVGGDLNDCVEVQSLNTRIGTTGNLGDMALQNKNAVDITGGTVVATLTGSTLAHNNTTSLQGGTSGEYYHLTSAQHGNLTGGSPAFDAVEATSISFDAGTNVLANYSAAASYSATWTGSAGSAGTLALSIDSAEWSRNGNRVFVDIVARFTDLGSWSGDVRVSLPVAIDTIGANNGSSVVCEISAHTADSYVVADLIDGSSYATLFVCKSATDRTSLQWSALSTVANNLIRISLSYPV